MHVKSMLLYKINLWLHKVLAQGRFSSVSNGAMGTLMRGKDEMTSARAAKLSFTAV